MARQGECLMKARTFRSFLAGAWGVALVLALGWVSADTLYRITNLGTLGGPLAEALELNDSGQVTGLSSTLTTAEQHNTHSYGTERRCVTWVR